MEWNNCGNNKKATNEIKPECIMKAELKLASKGWMNERINLMNQICLSDQLKPERKNATKE